MARWGICTTLKAPVEQVLAFVAHHLSLGADRIWLYFDDPDDPAADVAQTLDRVTVTRCDASHWAGFQWRRPERHQNRQGQNARRCYSLCDTAWLCHIDVDEFILPRKPIGDVLAATPAATQTLQMAPWEALYDPALTDDIFTARHFRSALRGKDHAADRTRIFGQFAFLLPSGVLSHAVGKCLFRTGLQDFQIRLHGAIIKGVRERVAGFQEDLPLLHFHAQRKEDWLGRLDFRLKRGAYQDNLGLTTYLDICGKPARSGFYDKVQTATPDMLAHLRSIGALIEADLTLREKVEKMRLRLNKPRPTA